ncbi:unnamed protein product, partial [Musa textilis]
TIYDLIGIIKKSRGCYFRGQWDLDTIGVTYFEALGTIFENPNLSIVPKSYEHLLPFSYKILHHIIISILIPK